MNTRITRIAAGALLAAGTLTATLAGAAPASAEGWHDAGPGPHAAAPHWYGHGERPGPRFVRAGWRPAPVAYYPPRYGYRGARYFDRVHGYWRDRLGYWNPSGVYIAFHF